MKSTLIARARAATSKAPPPPLSSRFKSKPLLPLDYFLNKANALSVYRSFIRATKPFGTAQTRRETMEWVRKDFERYRDVVDSEKSKTLLALARRQLKQMNATASLMGLDGNKWRGSR